jgi:plasmid stabilization system protein ParE
VRFTREAARDLDEAFSFYEQRRPGLGREFLFQVAASIELAKEMPHAWPLVSGEDRACRVQRFPYRLVYFVKSDGMVVLAVAHYKRRLNYWVKRSRS